MWISCRLCCESEIWYSLYWTCIFYYHAIGGRNLNVFDDPCISYRRVGGKNDDLDAVPRAYESAGTLRGMLTLLVEQCPKENGRAKAALDYLEHSRYRDYETALAYLSDSSAVCEKQIREVLKREIQKTTALTCH